MCMWNIRKHIYKRIVFVFSLMSTLIRQGGSLTIDPSVEWTWSRREDLRSWLLWVSNGQLSDLRFDNSAKLLLDSSLPAGPNVTASGHSWFYRCSWPVMGGGTGHTWQHSLPGMKPLVWTPKPLFVHNSSLCAPCCCSPCTSPLISSRNCKFCNHLPMEPALSGNIQHGFRMCSPTFCQPSFLLSHYNKIIRGYSQSHHTLDTMSILIFSFKKKL